MGDSLRLRWAYAIYFVKAVRAADPVLTFEGWRRLREWTH